MNTEHGNHNESRAVRTHHEVGVLLGVWAHPDDEAYLTSGLMSVVRSAGQRVVVATATKGELGTDDPVTFPPARLAAIREHETAASLSALGVQEHRWLGHQDGTLDDVPAADGAAQVAALIDEIAPDTIVTFGPDGMTGHSDHRAISRWVTDAWHASGRRSQLWYATVTPEFHREWDWFHSEIGFWFDGAIPPSDPPDDLAFSVQCEGALLDQKFAALQAHKSQTTGLIELLGPEQYRRWWSTEFFVDAEYRSTSSQAA